MNIPLMRPTLRRKDYNSVLNCLVTDQIAAGPLNQEFASTLSKILGAAGGTALISYRSSIEYALRLLELEEGDGVVLSALAPREYHRILKARRLEPLIVDVDGRRPLPSPESVEHHLRGGAKAIVLYYTLGALPGEDELFRFGVPVLEDVSQAVGGVWGGRPCGARGRATVLSLDPGGLITAGCGGAVFAPDRRTVRTLREFAAGEHGAELLPDMNAALGLYQVRELPRFLSKREEIARVFREALQRSRHSSLLEEGAGVDFGFPVVVEQGRPEVRRYAEKRGIQTEAAFADTVLSVEWVDAAAGENYPNAEKYRWRTLLFPLYPSLARKDIQLLCKVLSTLP